MSGRRPAALSAVVIAALVFAGCSASTGPPATLRRNVTTAPPPLPTSTTAAPPPPVTPVSWRACGAMQCAVVSVPVDYSDPGAGSFDVALARFAATGARIGSLVINPGGPGDSGIDDLPAERRVLTPGVQAHFDLVSFDPRGVGRSRPVTCGEPPGPPAPVPDPVPQDSAATSALEQADRAYAAACLRATGPFLAHVGTVDAARDLDRIRAALGDERLTFFGHSYGTLLGATYADMFPAHVRGMVLDGAIDPSLSLDAMSSAQASGFEASLIAFGAWCASSPACAWRARAGAGVERSLLDLVAHLRRAPLRLGSRVLGPGEAYLGVIGTLYSRSFWPSLATALSAADAGAGGPLLALSDGYLTHGGANGADAFNAITCLDHPAAAEAGAFSRAAAASTAVVFGPLFAWGELQCGVWPVAPTRRPAPLRARGAPPIVVVGTTGDPATPYAWAVGLAGQLASGVLVTRVGVDHVAYYYSGCVRALVERYFVDGDAPPTGARCAA